MSRRRPTVASKGVLQTKIAELGSLPITELGYKAELSLLQAKSMTEGICLYLTALGSCNCPPTSYLRYINETEGTRGSPTTRRLGLLTNTVSVKTALTIGNFWYGR